MHTHSLRPASTHSDSSHRTASRSRVEERTTENGLPDQLRSGLEGLSGFDLSHVQVHRNSPKPAVIGALAYAQGHQIHLAPGQERHLPHEGWHVVQQLQGRVTPTFKSRSTAINDEPRLEREADSMGARALQMTGLHTNPGIGSAEAPARKGFLPSRAPANSLNPTSAVVQRNGDKERFVRMIRQVRRLTEQMSPTDYAIGGSLAMQIWQMVLAPESELTRDAGDIDVLVRTREASAPMARAIHARQERDMPAVVREGREPGYVAAFQAGFYGEQTVERQFEGTQVEAKLAGDEDRFGPIDAHTMPVLETGGRDDFSVQLQSLPALLAGLEKKKRNVVDNEQRIIVENDMRLVRALMRLLDEHQQQHEPQ